MPQWIQNRSNNSDRLLGGAKKEMSLNMKMMPMTTLTCNRLRPLTQNIYRQTNCQTEPSQGYVNKAKIYQERIMSDDLLYQTNSADSTPGRTGLINKSKTVINS